MSSGNRVLSSRPAGSSSSGQKTILLVQAVSKTSSSAGSGGGAIQSLLLPASMRSITSVATGNPTVSANRLNNMSSMARQSADSLTLTPARLGVRVVSVPSSSSAVSAGTSPGQSHIDMQTPYGLVFNSRTIQADGTVCTSKVFLCNFCQYKVSTSAALLEHSATHLFSCNHCAFRSTSRLESLVHKRDSHLSAADELAGFEDLEHPTLVLKTTRVPRLLGTTFLPPSSTSSRLGASSLVAHPVRSAGMSLLSTVSSSTRPVSSSTCTSTASSSNVVRTVSGKTGDSYFTYRIAHDTDGRVQAYECDICGFRSVHINEMFTHASTHSLADLAKSGTATVNNVLWECFYCAFSAPLQASVVSHVIASHPNQPIQLKRLPSIPATLTGKIPAEPTTPKPASSSEVSPTPAEQPASDKTTAVPARAADGTTKPAEVRTEKKKKSDASDEGCIWGCYYCSMQSASRNDIISHLKKQHASEKLVVTRRRITHVATGAGSKPTVSAASAATDENQPACDASETATTTGPEVGGAESARADDSERLGVSSSKSRKRQLSVSASADSQQPGLSLSVTADSAESNDQIFGGAASAKSRRKQMAPRRVADELAAAAAAAAAADKATSESIALAVEEVMKAAATTGEASSPKLTNTAVVAGRSRSLLSPSSMPRKQGRSSMSKYDSLIKKLKMAESEENGMGIASLLDKSRLDEPSKTSSTARSSQGKALSLLTGQLVSGYVQPPNGVPTLSTPGHDSLSPVLNCEFNNSAKSSQSRRPSSGLKVGIVQFVEKKSADRSPCYVYDGVRQTARCSVCGTTARGSNALGQIREHVAAHFDECRWACAYCAFQCNRRAAIVAHITQRHRDQPLRLISRRPCHASSKATADPSSQPKLQLVSKPSNPGTRKKLRGPRCHRDQRHISTTAVMWQCAFCSRRSLFRGLIAIHMKLAHFDQSDDIHAVPQQWLRPPINIDATDRDAETKRGTVRLVRIEDVGQYPVLSDVILSNGEDLIRELDADDDNGPKVGTESAANEGSDAMEFRCIHCHFRGNSPAVVKCHVLQAHRLEDVTVLDLRSSRRPNHEHLLLCRSVECQFVTSIERDFHAHVDAHPSHSTNNIVVSHSHGELKSADRPKRIIPHAKNIIKTLPSDASPSSAARIVASGGTKNRRGTDGPIEYNDDGTMKALDLGTRAASMKMQCTHCCMVMCSDVSEMRSHLSSAHPRLVPLAIEVDCADTSLPASLFFCLVVDCDFITSYYNVYKHHMDEEHPDSETGSGSRHHRLSSAGKRRSAPSVHYGAKQDRSYTANVRRSKKPTGVLNSSIDNGHYSPSTSCDDPAVLSLADDGDVLSLSKKSSSSHSSQYSSQDFDFSRRYKCVLCSHTAATLAEMKTHLTSTHDSTTAHQCIDRRARQLRKRQGVYFCPDPNCAFCCKFDEELVVHVDQEHPSLVGTTGTPQSKSSGSEDVGCAGDRVYQCAHCTYITTDLRNVRVHVVAEHATTEGGFAEIKTAVSSDGSLIMNVNDAVSTTKSASATDQKSALENGDTLASGSGSNVKVDDEGKVFAVL